MGFTQLNDAGTNIDDILTTELNTIFTTIPSIDEDIFKNLTQI
ncbi:hypothetical protein [Colwellia sp. 20A7]|nr:hypothetical protein [Colwellia sp. 20A7]